MNRAYDVIVVGGGHAGCEAALATARMGVSTALVTLKRAHIGRMSCNPSVGGIAKSHIVFELDALGGEIARNTDYTGIQFRTLNTRKGPAVQAHRVQSDKAWFPRRMQAVLARTPRLNVIEGLVTGLWIDGGRLRGVLIDGAEELAGSQVILAAGTFLGGTIHIGDTSYPGGRAGERAAPELSSCLRKLGLRLGRLKTGTPPRLHRDSVDFELMEPQPGLVPPPFFSWQARGEAGMFHVEQSAAADALGPGLFHVEQSADPLRPWPPGWAQMPCYLTHTTPRTHEIIEDNLASSSLYGGRIEGTGVRYCPSIEDKIVRFRDKASHHVFVEPEGRDLVEIYPNGTSNSLPENVQVEMIRSIPGLGRSVFLRPGYAIEYDFADPQQLYHWLESKQVDNLYLAGQINGTTGYEEAACQGFVAGVNAALRVRGEDPLVLKRHEAYIGVLIDDLVTKGTEEPYRMFTSRAEHRLVLRQDNAALRLLEHARRLGLCPDEQLEQVDHCRSQTATEIARLQGTFHEGVSLAQLLRRPGTTYDRLPSRTAGLTADTIEQVEVELKYQGYIERERQAIRRAQGLEEVGIPLGLDYAEIRALRTEACQKLSRVRPETLGQASRISGVNPSDVALLAVWLKRWRAAGGKGTEDGLG